MLKLWSELFAVPFFCLTCGGALLHSEGNLEVWKVAAGGGKTKTSFVVWTWRNPGPPQRVQRRLINEIQRLEGSLHCAALFPDTLHVDCGRIFKMIRLICRLINVDPDSSVNFNQTLSEGTFLIDFEIKSIIENTSPSFSGLKYSFFHKLFRV